jgi:hypothetical protein
VAGAAAVSAPAALGSRRVLRKATFQGGHQIDDGRRPGDRSCLKGVHRDGAVGIEVVGAVEVNGINFAAWHKFLQVYNLGAFDIERLQLIRRERDELAALVFVALDDLLLLDFFAGARIVRAERDPCCRAALIFGRAGVIMGAAGLDAPVISCCWP